MWSAIGVAVAFVVIIVLVTRKIPLGYALIIGSFIAAIAAGQTPWDFIVLAGKTLVEPATVNLVTTLILISILGDWMKRLGILDRMVESLQNVLGNAKLTIMAIPSIMGTLLVTGGAMMAAPMVDSLGARLHLSNSRRAAINLLFRHGWYFIFPFMPTFILMKEIAGINVNRLILIQLPLTIVGIGTAYWAWLRDVQDDESSSTPVARDDYVNLLRYTSPIWSSLLLALACGIPFQLALLVGLGLALYYGRPPLAQIPRMVREGIQLPIVLSGAGIMIFKEVLAAGSTLTSLTNWLLNLGLPLEVIIILLPAAVSLVSASTTSAVGITLPLLLPAMQQSGHLTLFCAGVYSASFLGYFISPIHLCQVLTLEFFQTKMNDLYKEYTLPITAMWLTLIAIIIVGRWL